MIRYLRTAIMICCSINACSRSDSDVDSGSKLHDLSMTESIKNVGKGLFLVKCADGREEKVSQADIEQGLVCQLPWTKMAIEKPAADTKVKWCVPFWEREHEDGLPDVLQIKLTNGLAFWIEKSADKIGPYDHALCGAKYKGTEPAKVLATSRSMHSIQELGDSILVSGVTIHPTKLKADAPKIIRVSKSSLDEGDKTTDFELKSYPLGGAFAFSITDIRLPDDVKLGIRKCALENENNVQYTYSLSAPFVYQEKLFGVYGFRCLSRSQADNRVRSDGMWSDGIIWLSEISMEKNEIANHALVTTDQKATEAGANPFAIDVSSATMPHFNTLLGSDLVTDGQFDIVLNLETKKSTKGATQYQGILSQDGKSLLKVRPLDPTAVVPRPGRETNLSETEFLSSIRIDRIALKTRVLRGSVICQYGPGEISKPHVYVPSENAMYVRLKFKPGSSEVSGYKKCSLTL